LAGEALALSMALVQAGCFSAAEWAASLGSAIKQAHAAGDRDDGSTYYNHVLDALEQLVSEKSMATRDVLAARHEEHVPRIRRPGSERHTAINECRPHGREPSDPIALA